MSAHTRRGEEGFAHGKLSFSGMKKTLRDFAHIYMFLAAEEEIERVQNHPYCELATNQSHKVLSENTSSSCSTPTTTRLCTCSSLVGFINCENLRQSKPAIIYTIKYLADGTLERHKARLVVQGNTQVEGEDYNETFAPVVKMTTVRTVLRLVAANQWEVFQMDVNNAFLHGDLEEEVYMKLPPGFRHTHPGKVCRLQKSLYGLKQAPRCWFKKLSDALLKFGFVQSYDDYSLFSFSKGIMEIRVLVYVDDLLITDSDPYMIQKFKDYLSRCFSMKDLGKLKYFLGIEVSHGPEGFFLSQRKYSLDIVADTGNLGCRPAATPMELNYNLALVESPLLACPKKYRRLVGRLIYLLNTRPELCYSVHLLSQFMKAPNEAHMEATLRLAANHIAANPVFHERTKHIKNDSHVVRNAVQDGVIITKHVTTHEKLADILTKALGRVPFRKMISKLGVVDLHSPT
ncbi:unnamed protein product [Microthlaspi erraticum]|uniref:Reverse transcriptase Ty1/copia-type domain-containing protein n=1 Tax=Microthlaspi erraticum TaxID=1685480 RepID=A0A6D2IRE7_9BRAS|nr:unnamed protein product [Microthlaspi erraticum]